MKAGPVTEVTLSILAARVHYGACHSPALLAANLLGGVGLTKPAPSQPGSQPGVTEPGVSEPGVTKGWRVMGVCGTGREHSVLPVWGWPPEPCYSGASVAALRHVFRQGGQHVRDKHVLLSTWSVNCYTGTEIARFSPERGPLSLREVDQR